MDALVVIDLQEWMFRTPERRAQVPGLTARIRELAWAFSAGGLSVFDVRTVHKADRSTWTQSMLRHDCACLIEGTADAAPVAGWTPPPGAIGLVKTRNSAFFGTDLTDRLLALGVQRLVLTGVFADGCVGLTAAEAAQKDFDVVLVRDAIGHTESHLAGVPGRFGEAVLEWLAGDYDLRLVDAEHVLADFHRPPYLAARIDDGGQSSR